MVGDRPVVGGALLLAFLGLMVAVAVALTVSQVRELVHPALVGLIGSVVGAVIGAVWGATAHRDDERVPSAERERTTAPH